MTPFQHTPVILAYGLYTWLELWGDHCVATTTQNPSYVYQGAKLHTHVSLSTSWRVVIPTEKTVTEWTAKSYNRVAHIPKATAPHHLTGSPINPALLQETW